MYTQWDAGIVQDFEVDEDGNHGGSTQEGGFNGGVAAASTTLEAAADTPATAADDDDDAPVGCSIMGHGVDGGSRYSPGCAAMMAKTRH